MLIISRILNKTTESSFYSCEAQRGEFDPLDKDQVLNLVLFKIGHLESEIDEILIIEQDSIIAHYIIKD